MSTVTILRSAGIALLATFSGCTAPQKEKLHFTTQQKLGRFVYRDIMTTSFPYKTRYLGSTSKADCFIVKYGRNETMLQVDKGVLKMEKTGTYPLERKEQTDVNWADHFDLATLMIEGIQRNGESLTPRQKQNLRIELNRQLRGPSHPPQSNPNLQS